MDQTFDILIIGGGVNGAGIARDAAGRGLRVCLVEKDDLASATSSASSKLIHGGLRYLEHYEFRLVREALLEREVLLGIAPHIIWPLTFVLPHVPQMRSKLLLRAGLFLYDHLAPRARLGASRQIDMASHPAGKALKADIKSGFTYSDCWVDDARLVALNAVDARERGADIRTRTTAVAFAHGGNRWRVTVERNGATEIIGAKVLINAAGPWAGGVRAAATGANEPSPLRLVKGSHVIVDRLYDGDWAYVAQQPDKRIVFVIPYLDRYTLIGTTDVPFTGDPGRVTAEADEIVYLCDAASQILARVVRPSDVVSTYAGVRPLFDDARADPSAVSRDYVLKLEPVHTSRPPLLSVFGGKITTYRRLAEHALELLAPVLPVGAAWTGSHPLPGGDIPAGDADAFILSVCHGHPWLPESLAMRWVRAYGTRVSRLLEGANSLADLGDDLGAGLYGREVDYLLVHEFAVTAEDILWRRSKLGLAGGEALRDTVSRYVADSRRYTLHGLY